MTPVFLDTSYLIAIEAADDNRHAEALTHWKAFAARPLPIITTSLVFAETVTFFNARGRHAKAVELGQRLIESRAIRMVHVDPELFFAGWDLLAKHDDKTYSLTDCISFLVMEREHLRSALAFDRHFVQAGFATLPPPRPKP
ncbi:MAG: PIN domain-containing protein [Deltaproteobacteria bacterium]|nr:PIN domain-containing protein [Deltaproteobacteria bacterium]